MWRKASPFDATLRRIVLQAEHRWSLYSPRAGDKESSMNGNRMEGGTWTRREVFRVGSMATAAGVIGHVDLIDGATASQTSKPLAPAKGPQIYSRLGVRPFINLTGTLTINGGA